MSTRTIAQIVTECETRFKDTTNRVVTEAEWGTYVAEAWDEVVATSPDWPFLRAEDWGGSLAFPAGVRQVALDAVFSVVPYRLTGVSNATDEMPMEALQPAEAFEMFPPSTPKGPPTHYLFSAASGAPTLYVFPTPLKTTTVSVAYIAETDGLHGIGTTYKPPIPNQYLQALVHGALARAYEDDMQWDAATVHHARFQTIVERMRVDLLLPNTPGYPGIVDTFGS